MSDLEYDTLYTYMLDAMLSETGHGGAFYLLYPDAPEWPRRHEVNQIHSVAAGFDTAAREFEAEYRRRCDGDQNPNATFVYLE